MKLRIAFFLALAMCCTRKQLNAQTASVERPRLVVGLVVDQMRWDYLYRYLGRYGKGGFRRLLKEGFNCQNTQIPYIPTFTACGHACIYTGSVPSVNGIAGNDWYVQDSGTRVYCVEDSSVETLGSRSSAGRMSPGNLLSNTLGDELKLATNFQAKVVGIALKDRGGILPAGHSADAAYWFDDLTGGWISSSYYMDDLPAWVKELNGKKPAENYLKEPWNTLYPLASYIQSSADDNPYEGRFQAEKASSFPHRIPFSATNYAGIRTSPFANSMTVDFARAAIKNEGLGKDEVTDLLAVSFSATDYVGHQFGPNSIEIEDTYLRLDRDLESFFDYLDAEVGKGKYTLFLSADHGAAHNPAYLKDHKIPAGFWNGEAVRKGLNELLEKKFGEKNLVIAIQNYQLTLNNKLLTESKINRTDLKAACIGYLLKQEGVAYAFDLTDLSRAPLPEIIKQRAVNGYHSERSGEVVVLLNPGWYQGYGKTGTTHGTWNPYDAHIPLIFMGWGIKKGSSNRRISMADIASTVSALLHIQEPNGNIGEPITEILE